MIRPLALVLLFLLAGCGAGVQIKPALAGDGQGHVYDSAGFCDALARIAAADRTAGQRAENLHGWTQVQPIIVSSSREAADLYDRASAVAPHQQATELTQASRVTRALADVAQSSRSRRAFQQEGAQVDGFAEAQANIEHLNAYSQRTCGFTLADN